MAGRVWRCDIPVSLRETCDGPSGRRAVTDSVPQEFARSGAILSRTTAEHRVAFERIAARHRSELQLHCYRIVGSVQEAEDLVEETFLRAWRGLDRFEGRSTVRRWLYRIATSASLNSLTSRARSRRFLPELHGPPAREMPNAEPASEVPWLEPYPDAALEGIPDGAPGSDARYEMREAVQLAFIAAIQLLPPRQRVALILHDVLGWSASETAQLLRGSVAAVNSALQRARGKLEKHYGATANAAPNEAQQELLERYLQTWETADIDGLVGLLKEDAVLSMPPWRQWYRGRDAITHVFAWTMREGGHGPFRVMPTAANCQPAFAFYSRWQAPEWRAHSIQVLVLEGESIAAITSFVTPALFRAFALPEALT